MHFRKIRLRVWSDLHLEGASFDQGPLDDIDVIVLAGDISHGVDGVRFSAGLARPVVYVPGNHELYDETYTSALTKLRYEAAKTPNVHVLEQAALTLCGVTFIGATLWTDYAVFGRSSVDDAMRQAERGLRDHQRIRVKSDEGYRPFSPADAYDLHKDSVGFIRRALLSALAPTVVVTHHAPSARSLAGKWVDELISAAYVSNLEDLMVPGVKLWIHGHTHASFDYVIKDTRVICNPRGNSGDRLNADFNRDLTIELRLTP